ncbi:MAG: hypothetical protein RL675_354 [Bacteroidota bacterium]
MVCSQRSKRLPKEIPVESTLEVNSGEAKENLTVWEREPSIPNKSSRRGLTLRDQSCRQKTIVQFS